MEFRVVDPTNPHFALVGGEEAVQRLCRLFYEAMDTLPAAAGIRAMHPDLGAARAKLTLFLNEWLGGPKDYSPTHGHPRLRMRHARFPIGRPERDAWMTCMRWALEQVVPEPSLRESLELSFARTADAIMNRG